MAYNPFDMSPQYSSVPDDIQMLIELGKKKKEMAKVKPKEYALPSMTKKELAMSGVAKQPQPQPTPVAPQKDYSANKAAIAKIAESIPVVDYVPSFENSKTQSAIDNIKQELANEENIKAQQPTTVNVQKAPGIWQATEFPVPQELDPITKGSGLSKEVLNKQGISRSEEVSNKSNFEKLFEEAMQKQEKEGRTNILYENPLETAARINMIKRSGVFQPQEAGLENMRNLFEIQAQAPTDILTAPITGWMQTELGKNVSGLQAARGLTPEQQRQRLLGYEEKIQDDTKDLMAKYLEAARAPKIGTTSSSVEDTIRNLERDRQLKEISDKLGMKVDQSSQQKTEAEDPAKTAARAAGRTKPYDPTRDLEKHQKRMEQLDTLKNAYDDIVNTLNKIIPGGISEWNSKIDIPGVGKDKFLPNFALGKNGAKIRQDYTNLKNALLYARSGRQINESEYKRLSEALGSSLGGGDRELVMAIIKYGKEFKKTMQQREAAIKAVHPEVIELYKKGGGTDSEDFVPPKDLKPKVKTKPTENKDKELLSKKEFIKIFEGK